MILIQTECESLNLSTVLNAWLKWELDLFPVSKLKENCSITKYFGMRAFHFLLQIHFGWVYSCGFTNVLASWRHRDGSLLLFSCRLRRCDHLSRDATKERSVYFTVCQSKRETQIKEQSWHLSTLSFPSYAPVLSWSRSSNPPQGGTEINSTFIISIKSLSLNPRGKGRCRSFSSFTIPAVEV